MSLNVRLKDVCEARVDGSGEWAERGKLARPGSWACGLRLRWS